MSGTMTASVERPARTLNGVLALLIGLALLVYGALALLSGELRLGVPAVIAGMLAISGLYMLQPNEGAVVTLFGSYVGTDRKSGLRWVLFWYGRKKISLRVRNVTSDQLKVNDKKGNPIEIAANVVWRVKDTAQALFDADDYVTFINIQIDTSLRDIASHYAYDHGEDHELTLRADADAVADRLLDDVQRRVEVAGLVVDSARLAHLAYAPEIASAMLRRQQAEAVLAARRTIVAGAVTMVESALQQLSERGVVQFDEDRRAQMVSNLLVVLCAEREAQPVLNTGA